MKFTRSPKARRQLGLIALCGAVAGTFLAHPNDALSQEKGNIKVALDWNSYVAYHAPLLVSEENGYFKDEGIGVSFQFTRGSKDGVMAVGTGQADVGWVDLSSAMSGMLAKLPIKAVATVQHKNATSLVVLATSTIQKPNDLKGKRIGSTPGGSDSTLLPPFLTANSIGKGDVTVVNLPGSGKLASLMAGQVDAISGQSWYYQSAVEEAGKPARVVLYADHGMNLLDHGFVASDAFIGSQKENITRFLRAYKKGLDYTVANQDKSCALVVRKAGAGLTQELCKSQIKGWITLLSSDESAKKPWGWNNPEQWNKTLAVLKTYAGEQGTLSAREMYTDALLP
jgi:NitT/TauT family transport system substrate-binding protein